jgi:hypothetical protein
MVTFEELKLLSCRWPSGESADGQPLFCGEKACDGCPYCADHASLAYRKPPSTLRRSLAALVADRELRWVATET